MVFKTYVKLLSCLHPSEWVKVVYLSPPLPWYQYSLVLCACHWRQHGENEHMCTICGTGAWSRAEDKPQPGKSWAPCSESGIRKSVETGSHGVSEAEYGCGVECERPDGQML